MMRAVLRVLAVAMCLVGLAGTAISPAAGASRSRALARALGEGYQERDAEEIARAFRAAVQGGVEERLALDLVAACAEGGFTADEAVRVLTLAAQLALEELPVDSFARKIVEGTAKGAPPERVVRAAEARALTLNQARGIVNAAVLDGLEVDDRGELLADVAGALESGRSPDEVRELLRRAREGGLREPEIRRELFP